jgi:hypothetical protein
MHSHDKGGRLYVPPVITILQDFLFSCSFALFCKLLFAFFCTNENVVNVNAVLVKYKLEPDGDYHLILQEGGNYLVVEIPAPECARTSPLLKNIADARAEFDAPSHGLSATRTF